MARLPSHFHRTTPAAAVVLLSLLLLIPVCRARDERIDRIADLAPDRPGAVVAVIRSGQVVVAQAYGLADLAPRTPFAPTTLTNLGSTSKQFTAYALVLLARRGALSLDDDVRTYLPELPDFGATVTLRHLLTHTSGYRELYQTLQLAGRGLEEPVARDEVIRIVQRQPSLQNAPGDEWNYNNTGYILLSLVVERVTKTPFPAWMKTHVFDPFGLKDTLVRADPAQEIDHRAHGYAPFDSGYRETRDLDAALGAAAIYSTVDDLARWTAGFRENGPDGRALFAPMIEPAVSTGMGGQAYGLGLYLDEWKGLRRIFHHGDDVAHRFAFVYFPERDGAVVVGSNDASVNAVRIADRIAELYFVAESRPAPPPATAFEPAQFDLFTGSYAAEDNPGLVFTFSREGNRLWVAVAGERMELVHQHGAVFEVKGQNVEVEFDEGRDQPPAATIVNQGRQRLRRVEGGIFTATPPDLLSYQGHYVSEELETAYDFTVDDAALTLRHPRFARPVALRHLYGDRFAGSGPTSSVTFTRDAQGRVDGLRVGNGSNREYVHFAKVQLRPQADKLPKSGER